VFLTARWNPFFSRSIPFFSRSIPRSVGRVPTMIRLW